LTKYFPVVIEQETNGTFSAWVAGLPGVYAAAEDRATAKRAIREALEAHLGALEKLGKSATPKADLLVLRSGVGKTLSFTGIGALMGHRKSIAKAKAARLNGLRGGRPRRALVGAR
jgi:predicted RNase H-like HicB family nuclease